MHVTRRSTEWSFLGPVPYARANARQERIRAELRAGRGPERLLLLEHDPPVYTLGRNALTDEIRSDEAWRRARGIEVEACDRGGQVTYHGPGQLVGWPVLDLSPDRKDVRRYVRDLQQVLVRTLADFGIDAAARPTPEIGVWVEGAKIASLGIHLSRWITTHGFALNVAPDLEHFAGIVPCGMPGARVTSIECLTGARPAIRDVARGLVEHFGDVFQRAMVEVGDAPAEERTA
jgi:lipoate-protein ligase B